MPARRPVSVLPAALCGLAAALGLVAAWAAFAVSAGPAGASTSSARPGQLNVGVEVLRFSAAGRALKATGLVSAQLTDNNGHRVLVHETVAIAAATGGNCRVLHLYLNELTLTLLGLNAHLDKVQLDITGQRAGGVLGSLFCKLANARIASAGAARAAAAQLNTVMHSQPGHALGFRAALRPSATASAANPTCSVLDLVVGPLNLELLGLVVDLNRVHLVVTATRGGGALGDLFCRLADNNLSAGGTGTPPTGSGTPAAA